MCGAAETTLEAPTVRVREFLRTRRPIDRAWMIAVTGYLGALVGVSGLARLIPTGAEFAPYFAVAALVTFFAGAIPGAVTSTALALTIWFYYIEPVRSWALDSAGVLALLVLLSGAFVLIALVSWLRWSLDRLQDYERRLSIAIEAAHLVPWEDNLRDDAVAWGTGLGRLIGLDEEQAPSRELFMARVHPDDRAEIQRKREAARHGDPRGLDSEFRIVLPDGSQRWLTCHGTFIDRARTRAAGVLRDITVRKTYEEDLKQLNSELNHRMKNLFGICIAVFRQTLRSAASREEIADVFTSRIQALSTAQDLLGGAGSTRPVMSDLINALASGLAPHPSRIELRGPVVSLPAETATPFALVLHELAMNALKHGAWSGEKGRVCVSWSVGINDAGRRQLAFRWQEQGGPTVRPNGSAGQGSMLIGSALASARVHHELMPEGARCSITIGL